MTPRFSSKKKTKKSQFLHNPDVYSRTGLDLTHLILLIMFRPNLRHFLNEIGARNSDEYALDRFDGWGIHGEFPDGEEHKPLLIDPSQLHDQRVQKLRRTLFLRQSNRVKKRVDRGPLYRDEGGYSVPYPNPELPVLQLDELYPN